MHLDRRKFIDSYGWLHFVSPSQPMTAEIIRAEKRVKVQLRLGYKRSILQHARLPTPKPERRHPISTPFEPCPKTPKCQTPGTGMLTAQRSAKLCLGPCPHR